MDKIALVHSGEDYFSKLQVLIDAAEKEIHLQTYLLDDDDTGREIVQALCHAAGRGVAVYVLLDSYGSGDLPKTTHELLRQKGVQIRLFSPWHSKKLIYAGRRLHHKVLVVDGEQALIGGINISDKYRGSENQPPWLDYAVYIHDEKITKPLNKLCRDLYFKKHRGKKYKMEAAIPGEEYLNVRILRNDWFKERNEIFNQYRRAIHDANHEIILVASYFLPGQKIMSAIRNATKKKVRVQIVLSGISDLPIVMRATQYLYGYFLQQGVELYEWKNSILHAKIAVMDSQWCTIGSFNLNDLSYYANIEMNAAIESATFSKQVRNHLQTILTNSDRITLETLRYRADPKSKLLNWISYSLVRLALLLVVFFANRRVSGNPPI